MLLDVGVLAGRDSSSGRRARGRAWPRRGPPILFVHGEADDFTPPEMTRRLHAAYGGPKALYIAPGAGHGDLFWSNPAEYDRQVGAFLAACGVSGGREATNFTD